MPGLAPPGTPARIARGVSNARVDCVECARRAWGRSEEIRLKEVVGWILAPGDCDAVGLRLVMVMGCEAGAGGPRDPRPQWAGSF